MTLLKTGKSILIAWTDNGPAEKQRLEGVVIDLTPMAMRRLAGEDGIRAGRILVKVEAIK